MIEKGLDLGHKGEILSNLTISHCCIAYFDNTYPSDYNCNTHSGISTEKDMSVKCQK